MAKGRRLTSTRSERLLYYDHDHGYHQNGDASEVSEFAEEDVWSMVEDTPDNHRGGYGCSGGEWTPRASVESGRRRAVGITRHQEDTDVGGLSLAFEDKTTSSSRRTIVHQFGGGPGPGPRAGGRHMATSAPVNVPDWSKILRVNSAESMHDSDEDDRVGDSGMEPPHEYLARSRKTNAFSVFEGVGRTLKGRDMSRVRNTVWSQTGFEG